MLPFLHSTPRLVAAASFALAAFFAAPASAADASAVNPDCGTVATAFDADKYPAPDSANTPPAGFTALFNGKNLDGWWGAGNDKSPLTYMTLDADAFKKKHDASLPEIRKHWRVENGELINDGHGLFLTTDKYYRDFEFVVDYKTVPRADSGVYLRGTPQVQIWDSTEKGKFKLGADKGSGGLWNNSRGAPGKDPLVLADRPFGEWNRLRIVMVGSRVWVWLNGQQTVRGAVMENYFNRKAPIFPTGPILLQTHGGEIRWRNVFIREINQPEAAKILTSLDTAGFEKIFNGKDLTGWKMESHRKPIADAKDGEIQWIKRRGGTLYTEKEYADFKLRFEFKLPTSGPGNNGLAIRYPGHGESAYTGMELQIIADEYEKITGDKNFDPRQAHGSVYGVTAAHRGFQRPVGEWNYQEVTVVGSKVKVELNGFVILDTDVSKVQQYMGNKAHPGLARKSGAIGFAGHSDQVAFRNISIKTLGNETAAAATTADPAQKWDASQQGQFALQRNGQDIWRFNYQPENVDTKPFFHPLRVADGPVLTWLRPADHTWHLGLWFSWKYLNGVNYWEENKGKAAGLTLWTPPQITARPDGSATLALALEYRPSTKDAKTILKEQRTIAISAPAADGSYYMDWTQVFTALETVKFDRTPIPGEKGGLSWGGYAGLGVRFSKDMKNVASIASKSGRATRDKAGRYDVRNDPAMEQQGLWNGKPYGIAFLAHPENPRAPGDWYPIENKNFTYLNAAFLLTAPYTLEKDASFTLRYRVHIHPGLWTPEKLRAASTEYASAK